MDRTGQFLQVASVAAKRRYGARAGVTIEEKVAFPDEHRWCAQVRQRGDVLESRGGCSPEDAARRLADALVGVVAEVHAADRALLDGAALAGLG